MTQMNYSTAIFLVNDAVRAVATSYELESDGKTGKKPWVLYKTMDETLVVGDLVVVPSGTRHDRTVVRIEELDCDVDPGSPTQLSWVVDRVDEQPFKAVVAMEAAGIERIKSAEKRKLREELQAKLLADNPDLEALGAIAAPPALAAPLEPFPEPETPPVNTVPSGSDDAPEF